MKSLGQRRRFLVAAGTLLSVPFAWAQGDNRVRRVAVLAPSTQARETITLKPFFQGMSEFGWVENRNVVYDPAYANDDYSQLPALAADLVTRNPDMIYAPTTPVVLAARNATNTIPIVFGATVNAGGQLL